MLGVCARLEQADKATLLFGIADTDADEALTLEEFYTVCYLWRYANIRSANKPGQQIVRIDRRWVPSGTAVWFRATVGNTGPEVYSVKGGWERGVLNSNTADGMVSITARRRDADAPRSASLQQSLLSGVHRLNLVEVPEAEVRIVRWSHPVLAAEEILEQRLQPPWTRSSVRSFDLLMSVCVLLNLVQLGFTAASKTRTTGLTVCALLLLVAFFLETVLKAAAWGYHRYADHGAAIDMISLGAGIAQYAIAFATADNEGLHLLDVLLILQALRVVKLLRIVAPSMHAAVKRMATFALDYIYVFGLLLYVGAIVGNDLFAGRFGPDVAYAFRFDSFSASLLCLFEVSLVANW